MGSPKRGVVTAAVAVLVVAAVAVGSTGATAPTTTPVANSTHHGLIVDIPASFREVLGESIVAAIVAEGSAVSAEYRYDAAGVSQRISSQLDMLFPWRPVEGSFVPICSKISPAACLLPGASYGFRSEAEPSEVAVVDAPPTPDISPANVAATNVAGRPDALSVSWTFSSPFDTVDKFCVYAQYLNDLDEPAGDVTCDPQDTARPQHKVGETTETTLDVSGLAPFSRYCIAVETVGRAFQSAAATSIVLPEGVYTAPLTIIAVTRFDDRIATRVSVPRPFRGVVIGFDMTFASKYETVGPVRFAMNEGNPPVAQIHRELPTVIDYIVRAFDLDANTCFNATMSVVTNAGPSTVPTLFSGCTLQRTPPAPAPPVVTVDQDVVTVRWADYERPTATILGFELTAFDEDDQPRRLFFDNGLVFTTSLSQFQRSTTLRVRSYSEAEKVEVLSDYSEPVFVSFPSTTSSSDSNDSQLLLVILIILAVISAIVIFALVHFYRRRKRTMQKYSFEHELQYLREEGLIRSAATAPLEMPRSHLQMLNVIGHGQFGDVWKAKSKSSGMFEIPGGLTVAVKAIRSSEDSDACRALRHEAALMANIPPHPNVVALIGVCTRGRPFYVVLSYCANGSLHEWLKDRKGVNELTPNACVKLCLDAAKGLAHLAEHKIVHRDIAARNILLDDSFSCRIGDFGLSRQLTTASQYYTKQQLDELLPVRWTAIEALKRNRFSLASDVWSFGVLMWEIFEAGARPYGDISNFEVWNRVLIGQRLDQPRSASSEVFQLMLDCWHEEPGARPTMANCKDILNEIFIPPKDLTELTNGELLNAREVRRSFDTTPQHVAHSAYVEDIEVHNSYTTLSQLRDLEAGVIDLTNADDRESALGSSWI